MQNEDKSSLSAFPGGARFSITVSLECIEHNRHLSCLVMSERSIEQLLLVLSIPPRRSLVSNEVIMVGCAVSYTVLRRIYLTVTVTVEASLTAPSVSVTVRLNDKVVDRSGAVNVALAVLAPTN